MALPVRSGGWAVLNTAILMRISCLLLKQERVLWSYKTVSGNGSLTLLYITILIHTRNIFHVRVSHRTVCGSATAHVVTGFSVSRPEFSLTVFCGDFYTRDNTAAAVLPKRRLNRANYEYTAASVEEYVPIKGP